MNNKKTNRTALLWIAARSKKFVPSIILLTLISIVSSLSYVFLALASKNILDIATKTVSGSILHSALFLFAVVIMQILLSAASSALKVRISSKLTIHIRNYLFSSITKQEYSRISSFHSGDILNRLTSDTNSVVSAVVGIIPSSASTVAKIIGGAATLLLLNWKFTIIALFLGVMFPAVGRMANKRYKHLHKECQRTEGETRSFLQECFENIIVIKSFISELPFLKKLNRSMMTHYRLKMKRNNISILTHIGLYSFFTIGYYLVLIWGASSIAAGTMTYGTLMAFLQLISNLRSPLQNVSGIIPQYYSALASAERIIELEQGETEAPASKKIEGLKKRFKNIEIDNVSFSYDNEKTLKNCSFTIEKGKITALTGKSGCGKSTLFKLLLGLYEPDEGSIKIDGKTKIDCTTRGMFAFVPQGNLILSGTIRENITLCDETVDEKKIINAAKMAEIYDFIMEQPLGFDTPLAERGAGLSEGQIQRIAIARALLYDAPILLLDESTSALDEATESRLLANIKAIPGKTVVFITHRKRSLDVCDRVIRADGKKFVEVK